MERETIRGPTWKDIEALAYSYACGCGTRVHVRAPLPHRVDCPSCGVTHRINRCGYCGDPGHNRTTCPHVLRVANTVEAVAMYRRTAEEIADIVVRPDEQILTCKTYGEARGHLRSNAEQMARMVRRLEQAIYEAELFLNPTATQAHERV